MVEGTLHIEKIEKNDFEIIENIGEKCLLIYYNLEHLNIIYESDKYFLYKAVLNKNIIGFVIGELNELIKNIHIMSIAILDDHRSLGYGSELIKFLKKRIKTITLNVQEVNKNAIKFYLNNRFCILEKKINYYSTLEESDALFMKYYTSFQKNL